MTDRDEPQELPKWVADHVRLYLEDPDQAHNWDSTPFGGPGILPTLLLITTGRKSGQTRMLPLIYGKAGDAYVIVASKGGAPSHPAWYLNLEDQPVCQIQVGRERFDVKARTSSGDEREKLWPLMTEIYSPYDDYQAISAGRQIPVVVLEPVE